MKKKFKYKNMRKKTKKNFMFTVKKKHVVKIFNFILAYLDLMP